MRDYDEIERILRRYDFRTTVQVIDRDDWQEEWMLPAIQVLEDVGYSVYSDMSFALPKSPPLQYTIEINRNAIHQCVGHEIVTSLAHHIVSSYAEKDISILVECIKETPDYNLTRLRHFKMPDVDAVKDFGSTTFDALNEWKQRYLDKYEAPQAKYQKMADAVGNDNTCYCGTPIAANTMCSPSAGTDDTCYCGNPLVNDMCSYCAGTDEDYDEADDCCDWGDQIEALSDRIERLERGAKTKDVSNSTWHFPPWSSPDDNKPKPAVDTVGIIFDGVEYTKQEAAVLAERQAIIDHLRNQHAVIRQVHYFTDKYRETQVYSLSVLSKLISEIKAGKHNG